MLITNFGFIHFGNLFNFFNIIDFSLKCKLEIINRFENGLKKEHAAICSALITGYDDEIDKETISQFSNTGTLHVLSVSGLHTGIIYLIVIYFFNVLMTHDNYCLFDTHL